MSLLGFGRGKDDDSMMLPELPTLSDRRFLPELPSMPSTNFGNRFNNEMVKSAVVDSPGEMGDNMTIMDDVPQQEDFYPSALPLHQSMQQRPKTNEMVWVRIDKFQEAQKDFNEVKKKVKETELLLREVRAINQKEDAQVTEWVKDLERVKILLMDVDSKVFNQL